MWVRGAGTRVRGAVVAAHELAIALGLEFEELCVAASLGEKFYVGAVLF